VLETFRLERFGAAAADEAVPTGAWAPVSEQ
jgi:hypothetical protein